MIGEVVLQRLTSLLGLFVMVLVAWLLSSQRRRFPWRVVLLGLTLQVAFAILVLKTTPGRALFEFLGDLVNKLLDQCVSDGAQFVFGAKYQEVFFAFKVLPTIIFFSALMSVLYHLRIMQFLTRQIARVMQFTLKTSGAETLSATANIFVGQTEAPLVVKPYLDDMTDSEIMAVMVGGFATVSGGVMAAFVGMGIDPTHLLTASVISAPASLLIAKVLQPEVDQPKTAGIEAQELPLDSDNIIHAATIGAADGLKMALNVGGMLIAFLGLIAMINLGLSNISPGLTLGSLLGYAFWPFAWIMGCPTGDCLEAGRLLGMKMATNEFVAYAEFAQLMKNEPNALSERSQVILTYALCGFANFSSIGIQIGGLAPLAPNRSKTLARLGLRAMLGGTLACFMTACIAGILI